MKLNKKGFAITSFLYSIFLLIIVFLSLTLVLIVNSSMNYFQLQNKVKNKLDEITYSTGGINKYAVINFDLENPTIKRGQDFDLLEGVQFLRYDGVEITDTITYISTPTFNPEKEGKYVITYQGIVDGNTITKKRIVTVKDELLKEEGIYITDISIDNSKEVDNSKIEIQYQNTTFDSKTILSNMNSDITYSITVYNNTLDIYTFTEVLKNEYTNSNITYEIIDLKKGDILNPKKYHTFKIKFYYLDKTNISNDTLKSKLKFQFDINTWNSITNYGFSNFYVISSEDKKSATFDFTPVSGQFEKINIPLNNLEVGSLYQLTFTTSNSNTLITGDGGKNLIYGCTVTSSPSTNYNNSKMLIGYSGYNSGYIWKTDSTKEETVTLSFIATSKTMYWVWDLSKVSDKNGKLYINNIQIQKSVKSSGTYVDIPKTTICQNEYLPNNAQSTLEMTRGSFITHATYTDLTIRLQTAAGFEFINIPIVGLTKGKSYTLTFDNYTVANKSGHKYGSLVQASKQESGSQLVTDSNYLITNLNIVNKGTITFTATASTMYWVWDCGGLSDNGWAKIMLSNVSLK